MYLPTVLTLNNSPSCGLVRYWGISVWSDWHYEGKKGSEVQKKIEPVMAWSKAAVSNRRSKTDGICSKEQNK